MKNTMSQDTGGLANILSTSQRNREAESPVEVILGTMTKDQRDIFKAFYFNEKSIAEIAKERNVHKSTVSRTLARAENHVKQVAALARALKDLGWI